MPIDPLDSYISNARKNNLTDEQITSALESQGWPKKIIAQKLNPAIVLPPAYKPKGQHTMWDAFEHILMFISMYVMSISIGVLLHQYIEKWVPNTATQYGYMNQSYFLMPLIRGAMAALFVSFPLFSFLFLKITKRTLSNPAVRSMVMRKILIYLTLIITFIVGVGNIISTVLSVLEGNVTPNSLLHVLTTFSICSVIFVYYVMQVREDMANNA